MKHEGRVIPKEEILANRCNAYEFIDFNNCKDCNKSLEDCTCINDTLDMKQETLEELIIKEGLYRTSQNNFNQASAGYNAKWFKRGGIFAAKLQKERVLDFIYSEMLERRDYSASKMCEVIAEFIENDL
jgi:hypothetical protein